MYLRSFTCPKTLSCSGGIFVSYVVKSMFSISDVIRPFSYIRQKESYVIFIQLENVSFQLKPARLRIEYGNHFGSSPFQHKCV